MQIIANLLKNCCFQKTHFFYSCEGNHEIQIFEQTLEANTWACSSSTALLRFTSKPRRMELKMIIDATKRPKERLFNSDGPGMCFFQSSSLGFTGSK